MFLGISKYLGKGWRLGVGTKLGASSKEIREKEFSEFLQKAEQDLEAHMIGFAEANGEDYEQIKKENNNVSDVLKKYPNYAELVKLHNKAYDAINKILYSGNKGVTARRKITNSVYDVKNYFCQQYPDINVKSILDREKAHSYAWVIKLIVAILIIIFIFTLLDNEPEQNKLNQVETQQITDKQIKLTAKEKAKTIKKLKKIPVSDWKTNLTLYRVLLNSEPTNKKYQKKVKFYEDQGKK